MCFKNSLCLSALVAVFLSACGSKDECDPAVYDDCVWETNRWVFPPSNDLTGTVGAEGTQFTALAHVAPGVQPCSEQGYGRVENCYNNINPPKPVIERSAVASLPEDVVSSGTDTQQLKSRVSMEQQANQTILLPNHRTSVDGRLMLQTDKLSLFHPENLKDGFQTLSRLRGVMSATIDLKLTQVDPIHPEYSRLPADAFLPRSKPYGNSDFNQTGLYVDMCHKSDAESLNLIRPCSARYASADVLESGDCYDFTIVWSFGTSVGTDDGKAIWEIRSLDLTAFLPDGKNAPASDTNEPEIWLYPASVASGSTLPNFELYDYQKNIIQAPEADGYYNGTYGKVFTQAMLHCRDDSPARRPWCRFLDDQKTLPPSSDYLFYDDKPSDAPRVATDRFIHALAEPATTSDGRLLIINDSSVKGLMYAYNEVGPCDASGWSEFRPVSAAYLDPRVNSKYGFARQPVRRMDGTQYQPGESVMGAYPWIDRKGNNLMYTLRGVNDGYKPLHALTGEPAPEFSFSKGNQSGVVVMGAWTRGKEVMPDNGLNQTDFAYSSGSFLLDGEYVDLRQEIYELPLYKKHDKQVRAAGAKRISSLENQFNHYDVFSPLSPFDVVWNVSSTVQRNAELVFDEYLHRDALIVAPMNASMRYSPRQDGNYYRGITQTSTNGFVPQNLSGVDVGLQFKETPILQNASTVEQPPNLRLLGGATIPPVAEGGVLGKGIYFDGLNDHIEISGLPNDADDYYLGLWVNPHGLSRHRTLYTFPGGGEILLKQSSIVFVDGQGKTELEVSTNDHLPNLYYRSDTWFHLGVACDGFGGVGIGTVYINGNRIGRGELTAAFDPAASSFQTNKMYIGREDASSSKSVTTFRGYLDEFRFYRLREETFTTGYFDEYACNLAYGSLNHMGACEQIDLLHSEAIDGDGVGVGNDFPLTAYENRNCGSTVHRNHSGQCDRAMAFEIEDKHLVADAPRPGFETVPFCLTCHVTDLDPVPGMRLNVLSPGGSHISSKEDMRRQPMMWPRTLYGHAPSLGGQTLEPLQSMSHMDSYDDVLLGTDAHQAPVKIGVE